MGQGQNLLQFAAEQKKRGKDVSYVHVRIAPGSVAVPLGEIKQMMAFKFKGAETSIFEFDEKKEVVAFVSSQNRQVFSLFEKEIYDSFPRDAVHVSSNSFDENGCLLFSGLMERVLEPDDEISRLALKRLRRRANYALVLDDDMMVLKTMENIIKVFSSVEVTQSPEKFLEMYADIVPNIIFVDIHLRGENGVDVVRKIRKEIDPFVHAVMISSDSAKDTVVDVKDAGAKGFLVKPFTRDSVYKHLLNAPTFVPKTA